MCEIPNIRRTWPKERCQRIVGLAADWFDEVLGVPPPKTEGEAVYETVAEPELEQLLAQTDVEKYHDELEQRVEAAEVEVEKAAQTNELLARRLRRANQEIEELKRTQQVQQQELGWRAELKAYELKSGKGAREKDTSEK